MDTGWLQKQFLFYKKIVQYSFAFYSMDSKLILYSYLAKHKPAHKETISINKY